MLDAHHTCGAGRMDELVAAHRYCHVRGARPGGLKNSRSPGAKSSRTSRPIVNCSRTGARKGHPVPREDVLREAATIEPLWIGATLPVTDASEVERGAHERTSWAGRRWWRHSSEWRKRLQTPFAALTPEPAWEKASGPRPSRRTRRTGWLWPARSSMNRENADETSDLMILSAGGARRHSS